MDGKSSMRWWSDIKVLWGVITTLIVALAGAISFMISMGDTVQELKTKITLYDSEFDSFQHRYKSWRWDIEDALKHADLITFEAGILKIKGE